MIKLNSREQKLVLILGFLLVTGIILRFVLPEANTVDIVKSEERSNGTMETGGHGLDSAVAEEEAEIIVHVSGAVSRPGVYTLPDGARVVQAIEIAGGALPEADLDGINLAQPLFDGQQARIPFKAGELGELKEGEGNTGGSQPIGHKSLDDRVNINLAERSQLESLPGIGAVKAQSIINYREENGPFRQVEDLVSVSGIGEKTLEGIKDLITVY